MMASDDSSERQPLDLGSFLWACLSTRREENEEEYQQPEDDPARALTKAFDGIENAAHGLLTRTTVPVDLREKLDDFMPGDSLPTKLTELLSYALVQERLQFDIADSVVTRLDDLPKRLRISIIAFTLLQRASLSETAVKYLERAATLYLAGYASEVSVMCGAVLEAAMASHFPDEILSGKGLKPAYRRTGVFSLGQRMQFEEQHPVFTETQRKVFWELVNARNDAIHVQPDLVADPSLPVLCTAWLLPTILPSDS